MEMRKNIPIGIELVKKGLITEDDIQVALNYQKENPDKKMGDILYILNICDPQKLIDSIGEILGEKSILLKSSDIKIDFLEYISLDIAEKYKAIPFEIVGSRIKVCFADSSNPRTVETVRLILLNKGLIMEKYLTFESIIEQILKSFSENTVDVINVNKDIITLVNSIIKMAMEKRASDIHFEPVEDGVRIRYRIDGELLVITTIPNEKKAQLIGRLKAISNMHQEKQDSQEGRITLYPDYNIRASSQKNVYGEKIVLRLLKKNTNIKNIFDLGFMKDEKLVKNAFEKRNSITVVAAPTGEGKTTTLYSIIDYLNKPQINVTTIEDPVEIRIPGLNQIEVDAKVSFSDSLRTVLRQDPDIILVGEIRDEETAEIAMQAGQTGHYVLSTIHTIDSVEAITRLRKLGISNYDIASTVATSISQRLIRRICPKCAVEREFTEEEKYLINELVKNYNIQFDFNNKKTYDVKGCEYCNNTGYYDRIAIFEVLIMTPEIREAIANNKSSLEIKRIAKEHNYKPLFIDGLNKVVNGVITLEELNKKLMLY